MATTKCRGSLRNDPMYFHAHQSDGVEEASRREEWDHIDR